MTMLMATVTTAIMGTKFTMATTPLSITSLTLPPTMPHHHLTTLLLDFSEHQVASARMVLADLALEGLDKEALAQPAQ